MYYILLWHDAMQCKLMATLSIFLLFSLRQGKKGTWMDGWAKKIYNKSFCEVMFFQKKFQVIAVALSLYSHKLFFSFFLLFS